MALGLTYSTSIPRMISENSNALVQNIREIGKTVQSHLIERRTQKDIGAMAQEIQGLSVQTPDFPQQLAQLAFRHPLALRDERTQVALNVLGKAHLNWQDAQAAASRVTPTVNVPGVGLVNRTTGDVIVGAPTKPVSVGPNSRLVDPVTGETLVEPLPQQEKPFTLAPGATRYGPDGKAIATNPKPKPTATPYQQFQMERSKRKERLDALKLELDQANKNIAAFERSYRETFERERKAETAEEKARIAQERSVIGGDLESLGKLREQKLRELGDEESAVSQESDGVLPPLGAAPSAANSDERVPVIDPNGKRGFLPRKQVESALQYGYRLP